MITKRVFRRHVLRIIATMAIGLPTVAPAQDSTPIRIVVGVAAGGGTDTLARTIARGMETALKRTVIVENRPGAGGNIAAEFVARSHPSRDTLLMAFTSHTINATLYKTLPFDPIHDFTPITLVSTQPNVLIANKRVPANNLPELLDYARRNPGKLNLAVAATGSSGHMAGELFKMMTGADMVNIGYKGTNFALNDLLAGHVDLMFATASNLRSHVDGGEIKLLGVTSKNAMPQFPGVPPIADTVKGFESIAWYGLLGPAKMPQQAVQQLYEAAKSAMEDPDFLKKLEADGGMPRGLPPAEFAEFLSRDRDNWAKVIKFSGAAAE